MVKRKVWYNEHNKITKNVSVALFSIGLASLANFANAEQLAGGIDGATITLNSGDTITGGADFDGKYIAINSSDIGDGLHVNGDGGINVDIHNDVNSGDNNRTTIGINLANGGDNQLGTGSNLTVSNNSTGPVQTQGIHLADNSNLQVDGLTITVDSASSANGIMSGVNNHINLGSGTQITATSTGNSGPTTAVTLGGNSTLIVDQGIFTAHAEQSAIGIAYNNNIVGRKADIALGNNSTINVQTAGGMAVGIHYQSGDNGKISAHNLTVDVKGGSADALNISSTGTTLNLTGKNSIIAHGTKSGATAISANYQSAINIEQATIDVKNGYAAVKASYGAMVNLGNNSTITMSKDDTWNGGVGLILSDGGKITANNLTMELLGNTQYFYAANIQKNSELNLGSHSAIKGKIRTAIWNWGKFDADNLTIEAENIGIETRTGAISNVGEGSQITTQQGGALVSFVDSSDYHGTAIINFKGSADKRNTLISGGTYAVSAQFNHAEVHIENTDIKVNQGQGKGRGLWALGGGLITGKNVAIDATEQGAIGITAERGGKIVLTDDLMIITRQGGTAIQTVYKDNYADVDAGSISANGKLMIQGDVVVEGKNGRIDLTMTDGSQFSGATQVDLARGGHLALAMQGDSRWSLSEDSYVNTLALDGSTVSFVPVNQSSTDIPSFTTLVVEDLSGHGSFEMRSDIAQKQGDYLVLNGDTSGNYVVNIKNQASIGVSPDHLHTIIEVADDGAQFSLNNKIEVGGYLFDLKNHVPLTYNNGELKHWSLYNTGELSTSASAVVNTYSGNYLLSYAESQILLQRLGELRAQEASQGDMWMRTYGGKFKSAGDTFLDGYSMNFGGFQIGADKKHVLANGVFVLGGMVGFAQGNQSNQDGSGSVDAKTLGFYGSYMAHSGWYSDVLVKHMWMENKFSVRDSAGESVKSQAMMTNGLGVSLESGKRFTLLSHRQSNWYVQPQLQLNLQRQSRGHTTTNRGLHSEVEQLNSIIGRVGARIGYEHINSGTPFSFYAKYAQVREFNGNINAYFNDQAYNSSFTDRWHVYGVGFNALINQQHSLFFDFERADGGQFTQPHKFNLGYRYSW